MKAMKSSLCLVLCLAVLAACSGITTIKNTENKSGAEVHIPDFDNLNSGDENQNPDPDQVGPANPTTSTETISNRATVDRHILGPGLNRVDAQISFLRVLEQKGIKISLIQGQEMGAVVAALYAKFQSAERVEWYFYKYFRKNERQDVLSADWRNSVEDEILSSLGKGSCSDISIETFKMVYLLPYYSVKDGRVDYLRRGPLCPLLLDTLTPYDKNLEASASFEWGLYNSSALKKAGADIVIGVDVLGNKLLFRKENEKIRKFYNKIQMIRNVEKRYVDYFVSLPVDEMPLDGLENLPLVSKKSLLHSEKVATEILERLKMWKEKN